MFNLSIMNLKEIPAVMCERWGVVKKRKQIHVTLAPKEQENVEENVLEKLEAHRKMFHADLGGVLLNFDKVEVRRKDLSELPRWPLLYLPTEANFILFHPRKGLELGCMVLRKQDKFLECLFMGLFSVNVSKPAGVKVWEGDRMEIGMLVKVEIISVAYTLSNVPVMQGRIVDSLEKEIGVDVVEEFQGVDEEGEVKNCGRKIKREREEDEDGRRERKRRKMEKKLRKMESGNFLNAVECPEIISVAGADAVNDQEELKRQRKKEKKRKKERKEKRFEATIHPDKETTCEVNDVQEPKITGLVLVEGQSELNNENHSGEKLDDDSEIKKKRKKKKDKKSKRHGIYLVPDELDEKDCEMDKDFSENMDSNSVNDVVEKTSSCVESASNIESSVKESKIQENEKSSQVEIKEARPSDDAVNEELKDSFDEKLDNNERKKREKLIQRKKQKENKSKGHGIHLDPDVSVDIDREMEKKSPENIHSFSGSDKADKAPGLQLSEKEKRKKPKVEERGQKAAIEESRPVEKKPNDYEESNQKVAIEESEPAVDDVNEDLSDSGSEISRTTTIDGYTFTEHSNDIFKDVRDSGNDSTPSHNLDAPSSEEEDGDDIGKESKDVKSLEITKMTEPYPASFGANSDSEGETEEKSRNSTSKINPKSRYPSNRDESSPNTPEDTAIMEETERKSEIRVGKRKRQNSKSSCDSTDDGKQEPNNLDHASSSKSQERKTSHDQDKKVVPSLKSKSRLSSNNDEEGKSKKVEDSSSSSSEEEEEDRSKDRDVKEAKRMNSKSRLSSNNDEEGRPKKVEDSSTSSSEEEEEEKSNNKEKTRRSLKNSRDSSSSSSEEEEGSKPENKKEKLSAKSLSHPGSNEEKETSKGEDKGKSKPNINSKLLYVKQGYTEKPCLSNNFNLPTIWSITTKGVGKSLKYNYHSPDGIKFTSFKKAQEHEDKIKLTRDEGTGRPVNTSIREGTSSSGSAQPKEDTSVQPSSRSESVRPTKTSSKGGKIRVEPSSSSVNVQAESNIKSTRAEGDASPSKGSDISVQPSSSSVNVQDEAKIKATRVEGNSPRPNNISSKGSTTSVQPSSSVNVTDTSKVSKNKSKLAKSTKKTAATDDNPTVTSRNETRKEKSPEKIPSVATISEKATSELNASQLNNSPDESLPVTSTQKGQDNVPLRDPFDQETEVVSPRKENKSYHQETEVISPRKEKKSPEFSSTVLPTPIFSTSTSVKTNFEKLLFGCDKMEANSVQLDGISPILKPGSKLLEKLAKKPEPNLEESVLKSLGKPKKVKKNKKRKSEPGFL